MSENQETTKPKSNGVLLLVIIVLLSILAYLAFSISKKNKELNSCSNSNKMLAADIKGMNEMMSGYVGNISTDLKSDFQQMLSTYDALKVKDSTQALQVQEQKTKIQSLINQLNSGKKLSAQQIYTLKK